MKALKSAKPRYLITGAFLFAASWIGYWLGYMAQHPTAEKEDFIGRAQMHDLSGRHGGSPPLPIDHPMVLQQEKEYNEKLKADTKHEIDIDLKTKRLPKAFTKDKKKKEVPADGALLDSVRAKMAEHEAKKQKQFEQHGELNDQQILHKQYLAQQRNKKEQEQQQANLKQQGNNQEQTGDQDVHYSLIHDGLATKVHGQIHEKLRSLPDHIEPDSYIFKTNRLPADPRKRPSIGNGHVATVVHSTTVHMNGLYNGYLEKSHRATIPSTCAFNITSTEPETKFKRTHKLNVAEGIYSETSESDTYTLTQRMYAHRNLSQLLVVEIDLVRKQLLPLTLNVILNKWTPSRDVTFVARESGISEVSYKFGRTNAAETNWSKPSEVHVVYDHVPNKLIAPQSHRRVKWVFLSAIGHTKNEALDAYKEGAALIKNNDALYSSHVQAWSDVWSRGRIDVAGNNTLARALYGSYYYIMSSLPMADDEQMSFVGLSPAGLPYGASEKDYQGHVFWDQETWMYLPVLFFHSDLGKLLLSTRKRTAETAEKFAKENGRKGMQFPWESAFTGWDVTPTTGKWGQYELHITGDISRAIEQYLYATGDTSILEGDGNTFAYILSQIAHFWVSKLTFSRELQKYEIKNVMPPDEDASVRNNSVFTNTIAQMSLSVVEYALKLLNKTDTRWSQFADNIYIPFDSKQQYHPEYDGYIRGTTVKQADVILLGYPLLQHMPTEVRKNDLSIYQKVTRPTGPAMTWCMYSIGWIELGDLQKGHQLFYKNFEYIDPVFQVWNENRAGDGAANFITGAGGFLQNVISGYGGFRLHATQLEFNPTLPPGTKSVHFVDIDYLGSSLDFFYSADEMLITLKRKSPDARKLVVYIYTPEKVHSLILNQTLKLPEVTKGAILSANEELPENETL